MASNHRTANEQCAVEQAYALGEQIAFLWNGAGEHRARIFNRVVADVRHRVQTADGWEASRAFTLGLRRGLRAHLPVAS